MPGAGRLVAAIDDAGQPFVFTLCRRCSARLDGLPHPTQLKAMARAVEVLARHPERYGIRVFDSIDQAHLFVALEAEAPS
mgnify:FL=1